jgi:deoxyxylulose-5-phosphate synthase
MTLLEDIDGPEDLHELSEQQLAQLAQEVREHIIETVGEIGGHFGANLGTCELAVALHSVLDSPRDKILWDVGHQAYPHKILTGRRDQLSTIRQYGGSPRSVRSPSPSTTSWALDTRPLRSDTRSASRKGCATSAPRRAAWSL